MDMHHAPQLLSDCWKGFIIIFSDGLIGLGVLGGAAAVGGVIAAGAVALVGLGIAKATKR